MLYFFWSFGINDSNKFNIENWVPLKLVLGGVRDVHFSLSPMNKCNKTGSVIFILYFGLVALEGSTFQQNFIYCRSLYIFSINACLYILVFCYSLTVFNQQSLYLIGLLSGNQVYLYHRDL